TVGGTRPASKLQIGGDGAFPIGTLAVSGPLARLDARGAAVTGAIELGGSVKQLLLGNVSGAALVSTSSLRQATVTDLGSSNWAVAGDVGSLNVLGSLSADIIYAGNDA